MRDWNLPAPLMWRLRKSNTSVSSVPFLLALGFRLGDSTSEGSQKTNKQKAKTMPHNTTKALCVVVLLHDSLYLKNVKVWKTRYF